MTKNNTKPKGDKSVGKINTHDLETNNKGKCIYILTCIVATDRTFVKANEVKPSLSNTSLNKMKEENSNKSSANLKKGNLNSTANSKTGSNLERSRSKDNVAVTPELKTAKRTYTPGRNQNGSSTGVNREKSKDQKSSGKKSNANITVQNRDKSRDNKNTKSNKSLATIANNGTTPRNKVTILLMSRHLVETKVKESQKKKIVCSQMQI